MEGLDSRPCYVRILHQHPELFKVTALGIHTPYFSQRSSYKPMLGSCLIFYGNTADENSKANKSYRLEDGQAIKALKITRSITSFISQCSIHKTILIYSNIICFQGMSESIPVPELDERNNRKKKQT